ncbi:MAG: hypothetical protein ACLFPB_09750 [Desulfovermiculus sp.]
MKTDPYSQARSAAENIHSLEQALSFVQQDDPHELALVLACFRQVHALPQDTL